MDSVSPQEQAEARETAEHLVKYCHPKSTAVDYLLARALLSSQSQLEEAAKERDEAIKHLRDLVKAFEEDDVGGIVEGYIDAAEHFLRSLASQESA